MSDLIDREALKDAVKRYAGEPIKAKDKKCQAICLDMLGTIDAQPAASPWHSVEDELPKVGEYVLAWEWGKFAIVDKWCGDKWGLTEDGAEYTHWTPLPEPPREE